MSEFFFPKPKILLEFEERTKELDRVMAIGAKAERDRIVAWHREQAKICRAESWLPQGPHHERRWRDRADGHERDADEIERLP